jgi:hypothetical protein
MTLQKAVLQGVLAAENVQHFLILKKQLSGKR